MFGFSRLEILWFIVTCLVGLVMWGTQVGPNEAVSNLSEWVAKIGIRNPPAWLKERAVDRRVRRGAFFMFVILLFLGGMVFQRWLSPNDQQQTLQRQLDDLREFKEKPIQLQIPGFMQFAGIRQLAVDIGQPIFRVGMPIRFNFSYMNGGGAVVLGAKSVSKICTVRSNTQTDSEILENFKKIIQPDIAQTNQGQIVATGAGIFHTEQLDHELTREEITDIVAGRIKVYIT
jgi:hypothetical protein